MTLSMCSRPTNVVVGAGRRAGAVQLAGQRVVENLVDERTLARAAHAGDGDEGPEREGDVDVLQVVLAGALHRQPRPGRSLAGGGGFASAAMRRLVGTESPAGLTDTGP